MKQNKKIEELFKYQTLYEAEKAKAKYEHNVSITYQELYQTICEENKILLKKLEYISKLLCCELNNKNMSLDQVWDEYEEYTKETTQYIEELKNEIKQLKDKIKDKQYDC